MRLLKALFVACIPTLVFADVYSLSNLSWTLRNGNGSIVIPAKVPSQAHLDLFNAGIIEDPLLEQNGTSPAYIDSSRDTDCDEEYWQRWIVNDSWTYTADLEPFTHSVPQNSSLRTLLVFYGLDTIANIVGGPDTNANTSYF